MPLGGLGWAYAATDTHAKRTAVKKRRMVKVEDKGDMAGLVADLRYITGNEGLGSDMDSTTLLR